MSHAFSFCFMGVPLSLFPTEFHICPFLKCILGEGGQVFVGSGQEPVFVVVQVPRQRPKGVSRVLNPALLWQEAVLPAGR